MHAGGIASLAAAVFMIRDGDVPGGNVTILELSDKIGCTTFAFQPGHGAVEFKRYLVRFAHMVDGFDRLRQNGMPPPCDDGQGLFRPVNQRCKLARVNRAGVAIQRNEISLIQ